MSGAATKTLAMHAKTKEAAERLGLNKNILVSQTAAKKDSYRLKMLELTSRSQADKLITQLSLENVKTEVNRAGSKYEIHIGPFDNKEQLTQVRSQLQKMVSNKPLIVYTYKN